MGADYHRVDKVMSETVVLWCKTSSSDSGGRVKWTLNTIDGLFSHVYINDTIVDEHLVQPTRFTVINNGSLRIYAVLREDAGWFNCYEDSPAGRRIIGYYLTVTCMMHCVLFLLLSK